MDREAWQVTVHVVTKSQIQLSDQTTISSLFYGDMEKVQECSKVAFQKTTLCLLRTKKKKKKLDQFVHKALSLKDGFYELRCLILDIGLLFRILLRKDGYTESDDLVNHRKIQTSGGEKCR